MTENVPLNEEVHLPSLTLLIIGILNFLHSWYYGCNE